MTSRLVEYSLPPATGMVFMNKSFDSFWLAKSLPRKLIKSQRKIFHFSLVLSGNIIALHEKAGIKFAPSFSWQ